MALQKIVMINLAAKLIIADGWKEGDTIVFNGTGVRLNIGTTYAIRVARIGEQIGDKDMSVWEHEFNKQWRENERGATG